ncbi:hypothetical protein [Streptomyces violarus]|uniref:hypothetical protein n=1 Tax=Streptomyces violarus TaxID=67380 RepID=UPI0021BF3D06|nr:hypothetical protein [Streptomyces violarus]MCT9142423.1 hypothetical protein [Streptomyces violarus]
MAITIKIIAITCNGEPTGCPECTSQHIEYNARGPFEGWPSWGWCTSCNHSWEDVLMTYGVINTIRTTSTGRKKAEDSDLFSVRLPNGWLVEGELVPQVTVDDVRRASQIYWNKIVKPVVRKQKNKAKRTARKAVTGAAKAAVAVPAAALLKADWETRAGGWADTGQSIACPVGCDKGVFRLDSTIHDSPTVTCGFCQGSGVDPSA